MFTCIKMINYARPLRERLEARKHCGPYMWSPSKPGTGRSFYQARDLACGDSTIRLRLEYANDHLKDCGYGSLSRTNGYYCDAHEPSETLTPIIARLPHGRGYLAGWTMGPNMVACVDGRIYSDITDAARDAHHIAERDAEKEREYQQSQDDDAEQSAH